MDQSSHLDNIQESGILALHGYPHHPCRLLIYKWIKMMPADWMVAGVMTQGNGERQPVVSTIAALQAHYNHLQEYMSDWNKKQQRLLEMMSVSPPTPNSEAWIWQQKLPDSMNTMGASCIAARASNNEHQAFAPAPAFEETPDVLAKGKYSGAYSNPSSNADAHGAFLTAATKEHAQSQRDNDNIGPSVQSQDSVEIRRLEEFTSNLVKSMERSVEYLKALTYPTSDDVLRWLTGTLDALEDQMAQVDVVALPNDKPYQAEIEKLRSEHQEKERVKYRILGVGNSFHLGLVTASVIVVNAIVMGISADIVIKRPEAAQSSSLKYAELGFVMYYIIEIILRILSSARIFFKGRECCWNWFDLGLVLMSVADLLVPIVGSDSSTPVQNVSFFRVMRFLKMARLLRTFRLMKIFKSLRLILASISGSMLAMLSAVMLMFLLCYVASIFFVTSVANFLSDATKQNLEVSLEIRQYVEDYWSSVLTGMISLFGATTGGDDWFNIAAPIREVGWACYAAFLFYMTFFIIVILNTFASLFVHAVMEHTAKDDQALIDAELEKKAMHVQKLREFYQAIDDNHDGTISMQEFLKHAEDPRLVAWASTLDIDMDDALQVFEVLSHDGSTYLDLDSFVTGCIKVRGSAKNVDLISVYKLAQQIHKRLDQCWLMARANKREVEIARRVHLEIIDFKCACNDMLAHIFRNQEEMLNLSLPRGLHL